MRITPTPGISLVITHNALSAGVHGVVNEVCDWLGNNSIVTRFAAVIAQHGVFTANWTLDTYMTYIQHATTDNDALIVPIQIPHGAIVTKAFAIGEVEVASDAIVAHLYRKRNDTGANVTMGMKQSAAATGIQKFIDDVIANATIDNDNYSYLFYFEPYTAGGNYCRVYSVGVEYTVVKPQP